MWTLTNVAGATRTVDTFAEAKELAIAEAKRTRKSVLVKRTPRS